VDTLALQPIGFIRSGKQVKFQARHQPEESGPERNVLELLPNHGYENALRDLEGFSRIWLIWWFHRNNTWRPQVLPPRGPAQRRGLFATRTPHRPNPLGITPVQLLHVEKLRLILGACDLVEGTPVFDIKPYVPAYDSFPDASSGWIGEVDALLQAPPAFSVTLTPLAQTQADWLLANARIDFLDRLRELLSRDPSPHRTRRIRRRGDAQFEIGCGAWRAVFSVREKAVLVEALEPGYPPRFLLDPARSGMPDQEAQLRFYERWPEAPAS
jgi:tRNA-Thr(GGU) m(6)t(6)A37 methyltransferase TsaA